MCLKDCETEIGGQGPVKTVELLGKKILPTSSGSQSIHSPTTLYTRRCGKLKPKKLIFFCS
jgi:hypothetical protein